MTSKVRCLIWLLPLVILTTTHLSFHNRSNAFLKEAVSKNDSHSSVHSTFRGVHALNPGLTEDASPGISFPVPNANRNTARLHEKALSDLFADFFASVRYLRSCCEPVLQLTKMVIIFPFDYFW